MTTQDPRFDTFLADVSAAARNPELTDAQKAQRAGNALTRLLEGGWRISDTRYEQCQPDAPYGSYLLHVDPQSGLSVVLDVFAPGQIAAVHDHGSWGAFGCVHGLEIERTFDVVDGVPVPNRACSMKPGDVSIVLPPGEQFHQVECGSTDASISLHIYGVDIGRASRRRWNPLTQQFERFSSGYSNNVSGLPVYRG